MIASICLIVTVLVSSSMVALATSVKPVGELVVTGSATQPVMVNGEPATSGRTIFAASTITTPEGATAILDLGNAGKIELAPNSTYSMNADGSISGSLTAGSARVLSSSGSVGIKTLAGDMVTLDAGDMVSANSTTATKLPNAASRGSWWVWVLIFGTATFFIIYYAVEKNDGGSQVSPNR